MADNQVIAEIIAENIDPADIIHLVSEMAKLSSPWLKSAIDAVQVWVQSV